MGDINHDCNEDSSIGDLLDIAEKIVEEEQLPCFPEHIADDPNSSFNGQWSKIVHLRQSGSLSIKEEIDKIWINCGVSISVRFREHFAKILERIRWDEVTHVSGTDSYVARKLYGVIGQELQTMVTSRDNFNYTLRGLHAKLADPYSQADIVHQIKHVMNKERWIIEQSMSEVSLLQESTNIQLHIISSNLENAECRSYQIQSFVNQLEARAYEFNLTVPIPVTLLDTVVSQHLDQKQFQNLQKFIGERHQLEDTITRIFHDLVQDQEHIGNMVKQVLEKELKGYQRNQAYAKIGKELSGCCTITQLQDWFKRLAKIIIYRIQILEKITVVLQKIGLDSAQPCNNQSSISQHVNQLKCGFSQMIMELIQKGLIVEKNPPQVLMKNRKFSCVLRHLIGDVLDTQRRFGVTAHLVDAGQVNSILNEGPDSNFTETGVIVNGQGTSSYGDEVMHVRMKNMAFSLPIVAISHTKQQASAEATILWDNAFAKVGRKAFVVDQSVLWYDMLEALDGRWRKKCGKSTQRKANGLTEEAKTYLTMRVFNTKEIDPSTMITWQKFNVDKLQNCLDGKYDVSFWVWFFKTMELCRSEFIRDYWNAGYIQGFSSRKCTEKLLLDAFAERPQIGTFLLRFSEVAVVNFEPDDIEQLRQRSLADRVKDLTALTNLYPSMPKDYAFGNFYSKPQGYLTV